ncbi:hypothetical protein AVEN_230465-1 [Araneus ventricosus]|uniref:Uncharacterized protein n=1 Tax=Araneus ventricosus TaxID=182803 RepID=A0A4Y2RKX3_ARAVE|nr:hypothetical protein AVEN_230465-1 [Araneus ventricosus]
MCRRCMARVSCNTMEPGIVLMKQSSPNNKPLFFSLRDSSELASSKVKDSSSDADIERAFLSADLKMLAHSEKRGRILK